MMRKSQLLLSSLSGVVILGGSLLLAPPPAAASSDLYACSEAQREYARSVGRSVCGSRGSTTTVSCDGASIEIHGVSCN